MHLKLLLIAMPAVAGSIEGCKDESNLPEGFKCTDNTRFDHSIDGITTVGVISRVCHDVAPFGGEHADIHRASTCCIASEAECSKVGLAHLQWTISLLKVGLDTYLLKKDEIEISRHLVSSGLVPKLYGAISGPVRFPAMGKTYKSDAILMEVIPGQSLKDYISSATGLWHSYFPNPTDASAPAVVSEFNCLIRKALSAYETISKMGVRFGITSQVTSW